MKFTKYWKKIPEIFEKKQLYNVILGLSTVHQNES
jgi:hypothetical protein